MVGHGGHVGRTSVISVLVLGLVLCVATLPGRAGAWGFDGHHATCLIAEVRFSDRCFGFRYFILYLNFDVSYIDGIRVQVSVNHAVRW